MKRRNPHASTERAGIIAVTSKCNDLNLIWRDLLQEDVGVDGTIELVVNGFPTGKIVGGQIKSGVSYIRGELEDSFKFYPDVDDLEYWRSMTLPLFLFVHDPRNASTYWFDVQAYMETRDGALSGPTIFKVSKKNLVDADFRKYLDTLFDLVIYSDEEYSAVLRELQAIYYKGGVSGDVWVSGLSLFIRGLWGLCTKVQFHLSLLTDEIRNQLVGKSHDAHIKFDMSRATLFPFLNSYYSLLARHHLAVIDMADLNLTLYKRMEWPAFIAPLTLNGKKFVEFLRKTLPDGERVRDHQFLSFTLYPHVQIEIFASYGENLEMPFGRCTDVVVIRFNPYLDYYHILHLERPVSGGVVPKANQNIFYYELLMYLQSLLEDVDKNTINCRYQDNAVSPLTCWLNALLELEDPTPFEYLQQKPLSEQAAFNEELLAIMTPMAQTATIGSESSVDLRFLILTNGETLIGDTPHG